MKAQYPSYVDFDSFLDVPRLTALDGFIKSRIGGHIRAEQDSYFLNQHRLEADAPHEPGVREIWLSRTLPGTPYDYLDLNRPDLWIPTAAAQEFKPLMDFIATLPFAATGRILIIYDNAGHSVPAHRDHTDINLRHDFIWMRTNFDKQFYVLNPQSGEKLYIKSHSAWFDTVNQFHGADGSGTLSFSIRVDGVFDEDLRSVIPSCPDNRAAAAALWAATKQAVALGDANDRLSLEEAHADP